MNVDASLSRLALVAADCTARVALTTRGLRDTCLARWATLMPRRSDAGSVTWIATDQLTGRASGAFRDTPGTILFLQYTSGSTNDPKGVIVPHGTVIHNGLAFLDHTPVGVSWLPQYHDMGLIGYYLFPIVSGGATHGFAAVDFLRRPALWFETITRVKATCTSSPNFGLEYCLRDDKLPDEALGRVDLRSLRFLMNAAEFVRPDTQRRFFDRFAQYGLRREALIAAYGLAENTLAVTQGGRRMLTIEDGSQRLEVASCGAPGDGVEVRIVDPASSAELDDGRIGEIFVGGSSVCCGYWNRPELTLATFRPALRTGDLGFMDAGELFVCGRSKDVIVIRGRNVYPDDVEQTVEAVCPEIRAGGVAAFSGLTDGSLVVVAEVRGPKALPEPALLVQTLRTRHDIVPDRIVFGRAGTILRTTSGKLARAATRQRWLDGNLKVLATHVTASQELTGADPETAAARIRQMLGPYLSAGQERCTLADAGVDSLTMVTLVLDLEQILSQHATSDLATRIDAQLLQRLTVGQLLSLLNRIEKGTFGAPGLKGSMIDQIRAEQDHVERIRMQRDAELALPGLLSSRAPGSARCNVLLTGATGFFGPFLLAGLLEHTTSTYHVLIRARDALAGLARIREGLRRSLLWTPALEAAVLSRIRIVCGDIAAPNLGLDRHTWRSLAAGVDTVMHNAASVNYVLHYEALRAANVGGTRTLLRFAADTTTKEFHYISSTVIFGWTSSAEIGEDDCNNTMSELDFGYAQSKWVAEQLVIAARSQGLPICVYRPSFLSASTRGVASADDVVIRLLSFMINRGIAVSARNQVSFLPVDVAADNIAAIFARSTPIGTLHVTADRYYNMIDVTRVISGAFGYRFEYFEIGPFVAEMRRLCTPTDTVYPLLDFFARSHEKLSAMQHKRYNNRRYQEARVRCRPASREPSLEETVAYLMAAMRRNKVITRPQMIRGPRGASL
jgi:thioester reductase-like protein